MHSMARKLKALVPILILGCVLYFVGGGLALWAEWIEVETYLAYAGIVGGLASVLGLFSLSRSPLSGTDLDEIGLESFKRLGKTAEDLEKLEKRKATTREELDSLAEQRREMELLVRKASLALFLRERCRILEERLVKALERDEELSSNLTEWGQNRERLRALEEEIEGHPDVALLQEILDAAGAEHLRKARPGHLLETVVRVYVDAFRSLLGLR